MLLLCSLYSLICLPIIILWQNRCIPSKGFLCLTLKIHCISCVLWRVIMWHSHAMVSVPVHWIFLTMTFCYILALMVWQKFMWFPDIAVNPLLTSLCCMQYYMQNLNILLQRKLPGYKSHVNSVPLEALFSSLHAFSIVASYTTNHITTRL